MIQLSMRCFLFFALLSLTAAAHSTTVARKPDETSKQFAVRNAQRSSEIAHSVVDAKRWANSVGTPIIAFYEKDFASPGLEGTGAMSTVGIVYFPTGPLSMKL